MKRSMGAVACVALLASPAVADQGQATFRVVVSVPVRVALETLEQPAVVTITADDIALGYKDVSARYRVSHNDRNGYLLQIAPRVGLAREIRVDGLGGPVVLYEEAVEIHRTGESFEQDIALEFRFVLDETVRPGTFDLPVQLAALPL